MKTEVVKYEQLISQFKQSQMNSQNESLYQQEIQHLRQQIQDLSFQLHHSKDMNPNSELSNQAKLLSSELESSRKQNEAMKIQVFELTGDCQTMQRMYKILEENNEKLKQSLTCKNDELKNALSQSNVYQTSSFELALHAKQLEDQLTHLEQSKETIESAKSELLQKFNDYGSIIQKESEDKIEQNKLQYKHK